MQRNGKVFMIAIFCGYMLHADSIQPNIDFVQWQKSVKFGIPKKACSTCNFIIMSPVQDNVSIDTLLQNSLTTQTPNTSPSNIANLQELTNSSTQKDMVNNLQNSALHDLFDSETMSKDETTYDLLDQRQSLESYNSLLGTSQLNSSMPYKNPNNFMKAVFMKSTIPEAYQEILRHKGVLACMYCGDLDKTFKELPQQKMQLNINGVLYSYMPHINYNLKAKNHNAYEITISDNFCGMRDNLVFIQDGMSVELFVYSRLQC